MHQSLRGRRIPEAGTHEPYADRCLIIYMVLPFLYIDTGVLTSQMSASHALNGLTGFHLPPSGLLTVLNTAMQIGNCRWIR